MKTLTDEKLTIVGAAGMIGSNMAQTAIMMGLTSNICLYDPYAPGLEGVAEELFHCGFEGVNITFTSDIKEALTGAKYIVNSGGAARKAGMTREDLLKGNAAIAEEFGKNVKAYCPDVKHIVVIFNPADITGLITLLYSGLKPSQVTTLAALDSTRLRSELAKHFGVSMDVVENCRTYGGHGEQMAVYASTAKVEGKPLAGMIGTDTLTKDRWAEIQTKVTKGGANIIALRGRSSFQSPSYVSIEMIAAAMGGKPFRWPACASSSSSSRSSSSCRTSCRTRCSRSSSRSPSATSRRPASWCSRSCPGSIKFSIGARRTSERISGTKKSIAVFDSDGFFVCGFYALVFSSSATRSGASA